MFIRTLILNLISWLLAVRAFIITSIALREYNIEVRDRRVELSKIYFWLHIKTPFLRSIQTILGVIFRYRKRDRVLDSGGTRVHSWRVHGPAISIGLEQFYLDGVLMGVSDGQVVIACSDYLPIHNRLAYDRGVIPAPYGLNHKIITYITSFPISRSAPPPPRLGTQVQACPPCPRVYAWSPDRAGHLSGRSLRWCPRRSGRLWTCSFQASRLDTGLLNL